MIRRDCTVAVVGACGAVGREALRILAAHDHPPDRVIAVGSERSIGLFTEYGEGELPLVPLESLYERRDVPRAAVLGTPADVSRIAAANLLEAGWHVVDNSSAFRADVLVPLVIPEVNPHALPRRCDRPQLVANPNCSTIILLVAIAPLARAFGVARINVATYQAVSGAGAAAMDELRLQAGEVLAGRDSTRGVFRHQCAFNVFSHDSAVDAGSGINGEERKLIDESRRILERPRLAVTPTCVRVPVFRAHTEAITIELENPAAESEIRELLGTARGVRVVDDRQNNTFPMPVLATDGDDVLVGRIRPDPAAELDGAGRCTSWCLLVSADQLRKGAALNALQIAGELVGARAPRAVGGDRLPTGVTARP